MDGQEKKDIKIPIKDIVMQAMTSNGARYEEDEFNLLRKYFIYLKMKGECLIISIF